MASLWLGDIKSFSCEVHPAVPMAILQHYMRRPNKDQEVIGLLLGTQSEGLIHIKHAIPLHHMVKDNTLNFAKPLATAHFNHVIEAYPKCSLIGAYRTGDLNHIAVTSILTYEKMFPGNNLILLNLQLSSKGIQTQCYKLARMRIGSLALFEALPTKIITEPLNILSKQRISIQELVSACKIYAKEINAGRKQPDKKISLLLSRAIGLTGKFEKSGSTDIELVNEIAELVLSQTVISDKTNDSL
ncbi:unnamed protein product [Blepharisma stoltei]|uniref:JAB1/MPN/MOV34 metalloenzyme domain-containing protein n=1 Tax=Blepharisma stoltei TaxID=1481888 RepID=A0AAU9K944_9CILI|nr:unnamed protein product [Blepharisma stoltei]